MKLPVLLALCVLAMGFGFGAKPAQGAGAAEIAVIAALTVRLGWKKPRERKASLSGIRR